MVAVKAQTPRGDRWLPPFGFENNDGDLATESINIFGE